MKRILIFLVVLLPFLAKSQTVITGKYKYTDSLTFAKYKNNSTLDSVLSVDQNGRLRLAPRTGLDTTSLSNRIDARVKYTDTANMLIPYLRKLDTTGKWLSVGYLPYLVKYSDTAAFLSAYYNKTAIDAKLALKLNISDTANMLSPYVRTSNLPSLAPYVKYTDTASMLSSYYNKTATDAKLALKLNISDTANMLSSYYNKTATDSKLALKLNISDTSAMLSNYYNKTATDSKLALKLNISDTANMLSPYARTLALGGYVPYTGATKDVNIGTKNYYGNAYFDGFTSVAASGTLITLTVSSTPSYLITGSGGQTIKLPDATTLPNGAIYVFNNNQTTGAISVNNNSNTLVKSVPSGGYLNLELIDNSTAAGSWDAHFQAPSNVSWSTNTFDYPGSITSATWNGNTIAINRGGTGASTSGGALTNLGAQPQLNGTGFVKASGTTISYDNSTYLTSADIAGKVNYTDTATMLSPYYKTFQATAALATKVNISDTSAMLSSYYNKTATDSKLALKVNYTDTASMLNNYRTQINTNTANIATNTSAITTKLNIADTSAMLSAYYNKTAVDAKQALNVKYTDTASMLSGYYRSSNPSGYITSSAISGKVNYTDTSSMLSPYLRSLNASNTYLTQTTAASTYYLQTNPAGYITSSAITGKVNYTDTATMLSAYYNKTASDAKFNLKVNISDTASMLSGYKTYYPRLALSFTAGSGAYNNSTGVITIPTNTNQLTNGAGFISSYTETDPVVKAINGIVKSNGTTISAATAGTDYQAPISLTTTGSSGASTFSSNTLNVPTYTLAGLGGQPQLNGTGFVKATGTTISYDNSTYITGNQTITLSGDISGSGATAITTTIGALKVTNGMLSGTINYSKMDATTVPTWNQSTTGTAANITATSNATLTTLSALSLPYSQLTGTPSIPSVSGTPNYLPKFTGTSTIGNSLVYDNGTNVGINTTSPAATLDVNGTIYSRSASGIFSDVFTAYSGADLTLVYGASGNLLFKGGSGAATRLTLTASGNLGLGVTPSAWASGFTALQVKNASFWSTGNDASFTSNAYYDGTNYKYIGTAGATKVYHNTDGSINWAQAPLGTAGAAISFTQAMTLFSTGNLGINTASDAGYKLDVNGTASRFYNTGGNSTLIVSGTGTPYQSILKLQYDASLYGGTITYDANPEKLIIENYGRAISSSMQGGIAFRTKVNNTTPTDVLSINGYTGAATFSSSVTAGGNITSGGSVIIPSFETATNVLSFRSGIPDGTNVGIRAKAIATGNRDGIEILGYNGIDFTILNGATVAMRVVNNGNLLIGTTTDNGQKLQVKGNARFNYSDDFGYFGLGYVSGADYGFYNYNYGRTDLKITQSTGAATFSSTIQTGSGPTMKFVQKFAGTPAMTGNVLSVSIDGTTYYIQLYTTTL